MTDPHLAARIDRRRFLRGAAALTAGGAAMYLTACGSSGNGPGSKVTPAPTLAGATATPGGGSIQPVMLAGEFVAGQDNRLTVGLLDQAGGGLVSGAAVHGRFFTLAADGRTGTLKGEGDFLATELRVAGAHAHDSSGAQVAGDEAVPFYLTRVNFDVPGRWAVELAVTGAGGDVRPAPLAFDVVADAPTPNIGEVPPASRNDTAATNPDAASLCSRDPACNLHDLVIADVLGDGTPLVVLFSTPAFCETRFCGPVLELLLDRAPRYAGKINFVHIEIWRDFQTRTYREAVREWGLTSEPYMFLIGRDGKVTGRFDSIFGNDELDLALERLASL